jgi:HAD superfamily hydrolase (TIGR01509 family)
MPIRALLFDFDGLILDTETPDVEVWEAIYAEYGFEYPREDWAQNIGGWGVSTFDAAENLHRLSGGALDADALRKRQRHESDKMIAGLSVMDGVLDCLTAAKRSGLRLAIASSSERAWVEPHLRRLGLLDRFERVVCGDDVAPGRTKPHPDVFLKALAELQLNPDEAVALEDSPHGIKAAHLAGILVVAIPNPVSKLLPLEGADLLLNSLAAMPLEVMLERLTSARGGGVPAPLAGTQPAS